MSSNSLIGRRRFLQESAVATAGLVIGFHLPAKANTAAASANTSFSPNAFLTVHPDNKITIFVTRSEMGQGVRTALPMMLADELEADWSKIELRQASTVAAFKDIRLRTSGSGSVYGTWLPLRNAGAAAREMLISAAAARWKVDKVSCRAENGMVIHAASSKQATYGELCEAAGKLPIPEKPTLKNPEDFRFIGRPMKRVDGQEIVTGKAVYGIDVKVPGMRYAVIERSAVPGGKPVRWNDAKAKAVPGVVNVLEVSEGYSAGVAVVAENIWSAMKAREMLEIVWDEGEHKSFSSEKYEAKLREAVNSKPFVTRSEGDVEKNLAAAVTKLEAIYEYPFQAHAPLETMNCTADVRKDGCEIWSSTQAPEIAQQQAARILQIEPDLVKVNVPLLGGGFGRRLQTDYVREAVEVSKKIGAPVKVVWTREDDMKHGFFQPSTVCRMQAGLDRHKKLTVIVHTTASSDHSVTGPPMLDAKRYTEFWTPWGAYDSPYAFPAYCSEYVHIDSPIRTGPWRAVFYPQNVFARECFIDEIADAMGKDPLSLRMELLDAPAIELARRMPVDRAALRRVLETTRERSGWAKSLPNKNGRKWGRGIACNIYHGFSVTAQVAEVSVGRSGDIKVERIVCVIDCGQVINPLGIEGQMESGIVWGLSAALHGKITFKNGRAEQSSYRDFRVLRMDEMPRVEVYAIPSSGRPVGVGEPSVPPTAPAVANAIFAATGKRIRKLPFAL